MSRIACFIWATAMLLIGIANHSATSFANTIMACLCYALCAFFIFASIMRDDYSCESRSKELGKINELGNKTVKNADWLSYEKELKKLNDELNFWNLKFDRQVEDILDPRKLFREQIDNNLVCFEKISEIEKKIRWFHKVKPLDRKVSLFSECMNGHYGMHYFAPAESANRVKRICYVCDESWEEKNDYEAAQR